jgi:predicted DNA-binding transcriptional regulator YafY
VEHGQGAGRDVCALPLPADSAHGRQVRAPERFRPKTYAKNAFGITGGEKPIKIRLLFEPKLAVYITERQWHPSQEFHMRRDGRVEMRFETTGRKQVVRWVLSWMPDVKVLSPKSLRDRVCEKLEAGLRLQ